MSVNVELLRKTLAQIEIHPERWEQSWWREEKSCGTAYCFAGWAAVLSGAAFVRDTDGSISDQRVIPPGGGDAERIDKYAARILGIEHTADPDDGTLPELFSGYNRLEDLRRIIADLTDGA